MVEKYLGNNLIKYVIGKLKASNEINLKEIVKDLHSIVDAAQTDYLGFLDVDVNVIGSFRKEYNISGANLELYTRGYALAKNFYISDAVTNFMDKKQTALWLKLCEEAKEKKDLQLFQIIEITAFILLIKSLITDKLDLDDTIDYFVFNNVVYCDVPTDKRMFEIVEQYANYKIGIVQKKVITIPKKNLNNDLAAELRKLLNELFEELEPYELSKEAKKTITEFVTFKYNRMHRGKQFPELLSTYYNLLICCNDDATAMDVTRIISSKFVKEKRYIRNIRQTFAANKWYPFLPKLFATDVDNYARESGSSVSSGLFVENGYNTIYECIEDPQIDSDAGTGALYEESKKKADAYQTFWANIAKYAKSNPATTLFLIVNDNVLRKTVKSKNEIYHRIFGHRIFINPMKDETVLECCLERFRNGLVPYTQEFEDAFIKYFNTIYSTADLKGQEFVTDVVNRVYSLHFRKSKYKASLDAECIPKYETALRTEDDLLGELNSLVGLESVKNTFIKLIKEQFVDNKRQTKDKTNQTQKEKSYHMLFMGNPGTGKTRAARMVANILFSAGVIKSNKLIDAKPSDFISQYQNCTANKTKNKLAEAYDGVLFIDEAYALCNGTHAAEDALAEIIKAMTEDSHRLVIIFAGYEEELERLDKQNVGFHGRIGYRLHFDDYELPELHEMFMLKCKSEGYEVEETALDVLDDCIMAKKANVHFANGRDIDRLFEEVKEALAIEQYDNLRTNPEASTKRVFAKNHFASLLPPKDELKIDDLIGLSKVKSAIDDFKVQVEYQRFLEARGNEDENDQFMHMLFVGNPGTGKTTVAKLLAQDLYTIGVLKNNRTLIVTQKDILKGYPSNSIAENVTSLVNKAKGGILFIDEAYFIAEMGDAGHTIIETLLPLMEERKKDTIIVFAGYENKMRSVFAMNPGLQSRIGYTFYFEDYTPAELTEMFENVMDSRGYIVAPAALKKVQKLMDYYSEADDFGNGRFVDKVISVTKKKRARREYNKHKFNDIIAKDIPEISEMIDVDVFGSKMYDPAKVSISEKMRIAIHELGHAVVAYELNPGVKFGAISISNKAKSMGRVAIENKPGNKTEKELLDFVKTSLGGRCAEREILGECSTGCASDIAKAKQIIKDMNELYAMFDFEDDIEKKVFRKSSEEVMEIVKKYRTFITDMTDELMAGNEFTGSEFKEKIKEYKSKIKK